MKGRQILIRKIFFTLCLLMIAAGAMAGYPDRYYGPPTTLDGCIDIEAYIPEGGWLDRNPWGMRSPEEIFFFFGELCIEDGIAVVEFKEITFRYCRPSPWGTRGDPDICFAADWGIEISRPERYVLPWDPAFPTDWGFYIAQVWNGEVFLYESLTHLGDDEFLFVSGAFEIELPVWLIESDEWTRTDFLISPRIAKKVLIPFVQRGGGRVGP